MKYLHGWAFPDADEFMAAEMHADGTYQAGHLRTALNYVTDFSLAIDAGAHVGTWSRLLSQAFEKVVAAEPSPDTFEALVANMAAFNCFNVDLKPVALGAEAGHASMALEGRAAEMHNTGGRFVKGDGSIPVERIDDWKLPTCGFIKLDIEGSEPLALEGARETIARCKPIILFENKGFCRRYGLPKDAPQRVLTSLDYQEIAIVKCDRIWAPR